MAMEIEYFEVDEEDLGEVAGGEVAAADLVNGRGEVVDHFTGEKEFAGAEDFTQIEASTINQEGEQGDAAEAESTTSTLDDVPANDEAAQTIEAPRSRIETVADAWAETQTGKEAIARFRAEDAHDEEIVAAKKAHTEAALARAAAEEAHKAAKAHEKACLSELSALINRGPDYPKPVSQGEGESAIDSAVRNDKSSQSPTLDDPNADQSWRAIPIAPMLDGIAGMGAKKREAILSLTPTLGDFEDLRGKASIAHKSLAEVMPKGVGAAMCDELEERAYAAMRKHQVAIELAEAEPVDVKEDPVKEDPVRVDIVAEAERMGVEPRDATDVAGR